MDTVLRKVMICQTGKNERGMTRSINTRSLEQIISMLSLLFEGSDMLCYQGVLTTLLELFASVVGRGNGMEMRAKLISGRRGNCCQWRGKR